MFREYTYLKVQNFEGKRGENGDQNERKKN